MLRLLIFIGIQQTWFLFVFFFSWKGLKYGNFLWRWKVFYTIWGKQAVLMIKWRISRCKLGTRVWRDGASNCHYLLISGIWRNSREVVSINNSVYAKILKIKYYQFYKEIMILCKFYMFVFIWTVDRSAMA